MVQVVFIKRLKIKSELKKQSSARLNTFVDKKEGIVFLPLRVHSVRTFQGHRGDILKKQNDIVISLNLQMWCFVACRLSQLRVSVPVDLAILLGQILVDLVLLDLRR